MPNVPGEPKEDRRYFKRSHLLQEAEKIITVDRNKSYGEPDEDFQRIAAIASAMGFRVTEGDAIRPLSGSDVARFMIALKLSRLSWMPEHRDSWLDLAGYAACGYETAQLEADRRDSTRYAAPEKTPIHLSEITGHGYDGCPACAKLLAENPELIV
jgi:hypothetical protein